MDKLGIFLLCVIAFSISLSVYLNPRDRSNDNVEISHSDLIYLAKSEDSPYSLQLYYLIDKYSSQYNIPKHIAFNISFKETGYKGPFHWDYNPIRTSPGGALGPMQIMISTSNSVNKESVSRHKLRNDIEYNIETSMKLLRVLYDKHQDWEIVCGAYNTGKPIVNDYARFCNKTNYKNNWIKI
jgi:soluble lytic murein transglycosylase-like protein